VFNNSHKKPTSSQHHVHQHHIIIDKDMSNPSLSAASTFTVKSFDAIRKNKRGYRFPPTMLIKWRVRQKKQQKQRRRRAKQLEINWMNIVSEN
jgi:hypothetical protein